METTTLTGLPAQLRGDCRVLILGSMPGAQSLAQARYYAHPRNRLWPVLAQLAGFDAAADYPVRLQAAQHAGIGLWDVIGQCRRSGSLDTAIERDSILANPIAALLPQLPELALIACNGSAAAQAWQRYIVPGLGAAPPMLALPSTSPANASWSFERLLQAWSVLRPHLRAG